MIRNILYACICLSLFTGCVSITKELPAYKTYSISTNKEASIKLASSIYIKEPRTISSLNSKAIYYEKDNLLEKYALSKLSDTPSKIIQEEIASYFSKSNYIFTSNLKAKSNYVLFSEVSNFKQVFKEEKSFVKFTIRIYFKNTTTNNVYYKNFDYETNSPSNNAKGAILAFNTTLSNFLIDLETFIKNTLKNDVSKRNK